MQLQSKQLKCCTGAGVKTQKTKTPETNCKFYLTLNIAYELTKPKLLFLFRITPKLYTSVPQVQLTQC